MSTECVAAMLLLSGHLRTPGVVTVGKRLNE